MGVGFSTNNMSVKPTTDTIINKVIPNLKHLGITNFRMYNADEDAEYLAHLINDNPNLKLVVDTGYIMYNVTEDIKYWELTSGDVTRYLTYYIDAVDKKVKAVNGDDYDWLDNVELLAFTNEPGNAYNSDGYYPNVNSYITTVENVNGFVQDFVNNYNGGKYKTTITVLPISAAFAHRDIYLPLAAKSLQLQAKAGAPLGYGVNLYTCNQFNPPPGKLVDGQFIGCFNGDSLEGELKQLKSDMATYLKEKNIPINTDDIKFTITETGFATGGLPYATEYLAGVFYNGLLAKMSDSDSSLHGVDVYFFEALDEDKKPGNLVEPYWGLMDKDGNIKDQISQYWPPSMKKDGNKKKETEAELYTAATIADGNLRATTA